MHINDPDFVRRRILMASNQYEPKKRWDQNSFGSQRRLLIDHVERTLKDHENDADILEKFRRQAQELKEKKRRERFPYLFKQSNSQDNLLLQTKKRLPTNYANEFEQTHKPEPQDVQAFKEKQEAFKQKQSLVRQFQTPALLPPISHFQPYAIPTPNMYEIQARIQYEKTIAQKDLEIFKKEQKIKRQKKEINRLYRELKEREREDELQKYLKSHEEMKKMNQMLSDMKDELITSRKSLLQNKKDVLVDAHQQADKRRNKSELFLNNFNSLALVKEHVRDRTSKNRVDTEIFLKQPETPVSMQNITTRKSVIDAYNPPEPLVSNPEIQYSAQMKKNRSSVFERVPLYNPQTVKNASINQHLEELKNYNKRLEYLQNFNKEKLNRIH